MSEVDLTVEGIGSEDPHFGDKPLDADGLPEEDPEPVIVPEESVAAMHEEEDLGFGEIAKPEHFGVGQIRKELDPKDKVKTNNGKVKGKDK